MEVPSARVGAAGVVDPCVVEMTTVRRVAGRELFDASCAEDAQPCVNNDKVTTKSPQSIENSLFGFTRPHTQGKLMEALASGQVAISASCADKLGR